ncbi:MAG: DUF3303 family protein [Marmoricola sp.]
MKYVVSWETRQTASEELQARGLQVFSKWSPAPGADFKEFVGRVDGRGGFAVVEADSPAVVARDMAIFGAFFDMTVYPVLEVTETAGIAAEAVEFRSSIS